LHAVEAHKLPQIRASIMKLWLVAIGAITVVAARVVYSFTTRQSRRRDRFNDQVSSEWLATAKIHEDHP
jgi:uncharacterized protein involved in response to NO